MSSKIEVSRHLAEKLLDGAASMGWSIADDLRQLLAAPVVERHKPVAIVTGSSVQWLPGAGGVKDRAELFTAPPELAELQATIARLTAENERLKGGQGEPVAWGNLEPGWNDDDRLLLTSPEASEHHKAEKGSVPLTKLYTSQPAQVSVIYPDRFPDTHGLKAVYCEGWNACLDKVKELNQ